MMVEVRSEILDGHDRIRQVKETMTRWLLQELYFKERRSESGARSSKKILRLLSTEENSFRPRSHTPLTELESIPCMLLDGTY